MLIYRLLIVVILLEDTNLACNHVIKEVDKQRNKLNSVLM
jgi:hypothetical protein